MATHSSTGYMLYGDSSSSRFDPEENPEHIRRQLKPISELLLEFPGMEMTDDNFARVRSRNGNLIINDEMIRMFGDGKFYTFEPVSHAEPYTHKLVEPGKRHYYYSELWFVPEFTDDIEEIEYPKEVKFDPSELID